MAKSSQTSELAKMRLMLQAQKMPTFSYQPVNSIGEGIGQGGDVILQSAMQQQQQRQLAQMMAQEAQDQKDALAAKTQGLTPVAQSAGMDVNTLMALPDAAQTAIASKMLEQQLSEKTILDKAQALHDSIRMPQQGLTLDEGGRIPLEQTTGMMNLPVMNNDQAVNMVRTGGDKALTDAMGMVQALQLKNQGLNTLDPDRSTLNGQKAYRNDYQQLFGNAPVTDVAMQQEQANLRNTLLGNDNQSIVNHYLPDEKRLGLVNSGLDATGKQQDQQWKPIMNQSLVDSRGASTTGQNISNERNANELTLETRIMDVMSRNDLPLERKIAVVSTLSNDPQQIANTLATLSNSKNPVMGIKAKDYKAVHDAIMLESQPKPAPLPKPAAKPAGTIGAALNPTPPAGKYYLGGQPTMGEFLNHTLGKLFAPDPNSGAMQLHRQLSAPIPQTALPPARPTTLSGIRQAKSNALANVGQANQNIQMANGLVKQGNQAIAGAQGTLGMVDANEQRRRKMSQGILRY